MSTRDWHYNELHVKSIWIKNLYHENLILLNRFLCCFFWIINSCLVYCYPEHAGCSKFKMVVLTFDFYRFFSKFKIDFEWENFIFWRLMVNELHRDLKIRIFSTFWLELIQNGNQKNVPPLRKHQNTFGAKATTTAHSSNINFHFFSQLDNIWRQLWTLFRQIYGNPRITYSGWLTFFFSKE